LCSDIGAALGTGGCLQSLRRLEIGRFSLTDAVSLSELHGERDVERSLLPLPQALAHLPKISCTQEQAERVLHGSRIRIVDVAGLPVADSWACAFGPDNRLLAVGKLIAENDEMFFQPKKMLVVSP